MNSTPGLGEATAIRLSLTALFALCALVYPGDSIAAPPIVEDQWIQVESANFTFFSNASVRRTLQLATDLEELRFTLAEFAGLDRESPAPSLVHVFRDDVAFMPYKSLYRGEPASADGYFILTGDRNYIAINGDARDGLDGVIFHEYLHYVVAHNVPTVPLWFNEGLAEFFKTFRAMDGGAVIGTSVDSHAEHLRKHRLMPLGRLFAVDRDSTVYNQGELRNTFYAQSWALVHYLLLGDHARCPEARDFRNLLMQGVSQSEAFDTAFSGDYRRLQTELKKYVKRSHYSTATVPEGARLGDVPPVVEEMSPADVLYRLGDLLAQHDPERPEAKDHLSAAIVQDPMHGGALSALGTYAEADERWQDAKELHARAASAAPDDFLVQYRYGMLLLDQDDAGSAVPVLERCTRLNPQHGLAWARLAYAIWGSGESTRQALDAAEKAHALLPSNISITHNLLLLYLGAGDLDAARELVATGFVGSEEHATRARIALAGEEIQVVHGLIEAGDLLRARAALDRIDSDVGESEEGAAIRKQLDETRRRIEHYPHIQRYRKAVVLFNEKEYEAARILLEDLLAEAPDGPHVESSQQLLQTTVEHIEKTRLRRERIRAVTEEKQARLDRLNESLDRGELEEALLQLQQMKRLGDDTGTWIDQKITQVETAISHNRFVDAYNRALDLDRAGNYAMACSVLEDLLEGPLSTSQALKARKLLEEVRAKRGLR